MIRVEMSVVLYVSGDVNNEEDAERALLLEEDVWDILADGEEQLKEKFDFVTVDYVGTLEVSNDHEGIYSQS